MFCSWSVRWSVRHAGRSLLGVRPPICRALEGACIVGSLPCSALAVAIAVCRLPQLAQFVVGLWTANTKLHRARPSFNPISPDAEL